MDLGTGGWEASFQRVARGLAAVEERVFSLERDEGARMHLGGGGLGDDAALERMSLLGTRVGDVEERGRAMLADVRALQAWQRQQAAPYGARDAKGRVGSVGMDDLEGYKARLAAIETQVRRP